MMDVCEWMRHSEILSYLISHTFRICFVHYCKSLCSDNEFTISYQIRRRRCKGKGSERSDGVGHCLLRCRYGQAVFKPWLHLWGLHRGWIAGKQAGLHAAVALVTYSNEARVSTDTSKILSAQNAFRSLFSFHPLSHFFPSLLRSLSFYPPFPLFIHSFSRTKPDHRHAADVMVTIVTETSQQRGCAKRVRSGER